MGAVIYACVTRSGTGYLKEEKPAETINGFFERRSPDRNPGFCVV